MIHLIRHFNTIRVPGLSRFEQQRLFTDYEAWTLFRIAAFSEAVGWTLLLIGIFLKYQIMHGNDAPVRLAGSVHGMVFLFYAAIAFVTYPSLGWSRFTGVLALASSVPPFGSLIFEQAMAYLRRYDATRWWFATSVYNLLIVADD